MMNKPYNGYVYKLVHKENEKVYIGSRWLNRRYRKPEDDLKFFYKTSSSSVKREIKKRGVDIFEWYILAQFQSDRECLLYEQSILLDLIEKGDVLGVSLYNKSLPLEGATSYILNETVEDRKRRGENIAKSEGKRHQWDDPEKRKKHSDALKNYWKNHPEEAKERAQGFKLKYDTNQEFKEQFLVKVSRANKNKLKNEKIQKKRAETFKDPKVKENFILRVREGKNTLESKKKQSESARIRSLKEKGVFVTPYGIFRSVQDAAEQLSISVNTLRGRLYRDFKNPIEKRLYFHKGN